MIAHFGIFFINLNASRYYPVHLIHWGSVSNVTLLLCKRNVSQLMKWIREWGVMKHQFYNKNCGVCRLVLIEAILDLETLWRIKLIIMHTGMNLIVRTLINEFKRGRKCYWFTLLNRRNCHWKLIDLKRGVMLTFLWGREVFFVCILYEMNRVITVL